LSMELHQRIANETDASRIVLESTLYCRQAGFEEAPSRMVATAVSELVRNILKYAGTGDVWVRHAKNMGKRGIEIEALDRGPGIANCEEAMQDHFSSGGTLGLGLPAVKRMMDEFSLESSLGKGTRVTARKWM
jgi:serine/threonine-protein kinase RsbT